MEKTCDFCHKEHLKVDEYIIAANGEIVCEDCWAYVFDLLQEREDFVYKTEVDIG